MSNCSKPAKTATMDLKAMDEVTTFINNNPNTNYQEVAQHISWYWDQSNMSPYLVDWIMGHLNNQGN